MALLCWLRTHHFKLVVCRRCEEQTDLWTLKNFGHARAMNPTQRARISTAVAYAVRELAGISGSVALDVIRKLALAASGEDGYLASNVVALITTLRLTLLSARSDDEANATIVLDNCTLRDLDMTLGYRDGLPMRLEFNACKFPSTVVWCLPFGTLMTTAIDADGRFVLAAGSDGRVLLCKLDKTTAVINHIVISKNFHVDWVRAIALVKLNGGDFALTCGSGNTLRLWKIDAEKVTVEEQNTDKRLELPARTWQLSPIDANHGARMWRAYVDNHVDANDAFVLAAASDGVYLIKVSSKTTEIEKWLLNASADWHASPRRAVVMGRPSGGSVKTCGVLMIVGSKLQRTSFGKRSKNPSDVALPDDPPSSSSGTRKRVCLDIAHSQSLLAVARATHFVLYSVSDVEAPPHGGAEPDDDDNDIEQAINHQYKRVLFLGRPARRVAFANLKSDNMVTGCVALVGG
jgi:hypothetical protein